MKNKYTGCLQSFRGWLGAAREKCASSVVKYILLISVFQVALLGIFIYTLVYIYSLQQVNTALQQANTTLEQHKDQLKTELATLKDAQEYEVRRMNVTNYAPLDAKAVYGWDYTSDPKITASGKEVVPGETAAAGPNIPFGSRIYVEGEGWYTVKDRGGRIGVDDIDLAVESKEEASEWGVQEKLVIINRP